MEQKLSIMDKCQLEIMSDMHNMLGKAKKILQQQVYHETPSNNYRDIIMPIIHEEFNKASLFDTKNTIYERAVRKVIDALDLNGIWANKYPTNLISIHRDVSQMLEELYKKLMSSDAKLDALTMKFNHFKSSDFHELTTIKNLLKEFQKCCEIIIDKEKVLKDNQLNIILGIDGLSDFTSYVHNLSVGNIPIKSADKHVIAVRHLYQQIPNVLTGKDSMYIIVKILLDIYYPYINDQTWKVIIDNEIKNIDNYLFKQSQYFKEIETLTSKDFLNKMKNIYTEFVDELPNLALEKINIFINSLKKRNDSKLNSNNDKNNNNNNNKRKIEKENDSENELSDKKKNTKKSEKMFKLKKVRDE